tara:strand:+ start:36 stop:203 length:168 start_codon:yes stop_codon:yes gene_type:complete
MKASDIILADNYKKALEKLKEKEDQLNSIKKIVPDKVSLTNYRSFVKRLRIELSK